MARPIVAIVLLASFLAGCGGPGPSPAATRSAGTTGAAPVTSDTPPLRYVALGDSYTIGTSVSLGERWPNQLVAALAGGTTHLDLVANLGVNGYTSRDVIDVELPQLASLQPAFVTLLRSEERRVGKECRL